MVLQLPCGWTHVAQLFTPLEGRVLYLPGADVSMPGSLKLERGPGRQGGRVPQAPQLAIMLILAAPQQ